MLARRYDPDEVRRQYARVAWFYDAWSRLTEARAQDLVLADAGVADGSDILEVAVGTGRLFAALAAGNRSGRTVGVDLSPAMLAQARSRMAQGQEGGTYELLEASAYSLPFEDGRFDLVVNCFMLDLLPEADHARLLREFARVLKPGGRLALSWFSEGGHWYNRLWPWLARHVPALLTGCRPVELEGAVTRAGFEILSRAEVSQMTFPSTVLVARKVARG